MIGWEFGLAPRLGMRRTFLIVRSREELRTWLEAGLVPLLVQAMSHTLPSGGFNCSLGVQY